MNWRRTFIMIKNFNNITMNTLIMNETSKK